MITDLILFFRRVRRAAHPTMRGMSIVQHSDATIEFQIWHWSDLLYFFIHGRYEGKVDLRGILGNVRFLYVRDRRLQYDGSYYYFFPIGWMLNLSQYYRLVWYGIPRYLIAHGIAERRYPEKPARWLWMLDIRLKRSPERSGP